MTNYNEYEDNTKSGYNGEGRQSFSFGNASEEYAQQDSMNYTDYSSQSGTDADSFGGNDVNSGISNSQEHQTIYSDSFENVQSEKYGAQSYPSYGAQQQYESIQAQRYSNSYGENGSSAYAHQDSAYGYNRQISGQPHHMSSYSPIPNANYSYSNYRASNGEAPYSSSYTSKTSDAGKQSAPKKEKANKKRSFSFGALIASILTTAVLCSGITGAIGYISVKDDINSIKASAASAAASSSTVTPSAQTSPIKNITVNDESDNAVSTVAEKCSPSVVGIRVTTSGGYSMFGYGDSASEGSGVIYTEDGYIITNYHVVSSAVEQSTGSSNNYYDDFFGFNFGGRQSQQPVTATVEVFLPSDVETGIPAEIIGYDVTSDLAVIKIDKTGLPAIEVADSDVIKIGDRVVTIGNPGGLEFMGTVSAGVISGLDRTLYSENGIEMNLIQTDALINPGNSGGALVNSEGKLVGINNSKIVRSGFERMGFSIPSNTVKTICDRIISKEHEPSAYLGVTIDTNYSSAMLQRYGYPGGVVVFSVAEGSPAEQAGIQQYDIITAINGNNINSYEQLNSETNRYSPGETITITIYREGQEKSISLTLGTSGATVPKLSD